MGLPASSARLLAFTSREHSITNSLMHCSMQKTSLARDMQKVSRNYQDALNSKVLKWTSNSGASYSDISYSNLMQPSYMNKNKAYLLTDLNGRIVVDNKYKKYAEMISEKGGYDNCRYEILSELTGVDATTLKNIHAYHEQIFDAKTAMDSFRPKPNPTDYKNLQQKGTEDLLEKIDFEGTGYSGTSFSKGKNWSDAYDKNATIKIKDGNINNYIFDTIGKKISTALEEYFIDDEQKKHFNEAITATCQMYTNLIIGKEELNGATLSGSTKKGFELNVRSFIDEIISAFINKGGEYKSTNGKGEEPIWYDTKSDAYKQYKNDLNTWEKEYEAQVNSYNKLNSESGQLVTNEIEQKINFYDELFSSITEKGWVYNNSVTDNNYLNQMLQNNIYTITEVNREHHCDKEDGHYYTNTYISDIAKNMTNVVEVSDEDAILEAQVKYENEKAVISEKESRIDLRMENLKLEIESIKQMKKGLETVMKDNIDRTMNIMT